MTKRYTIEKVTKRGQLKLVESVREKQKAINYAWALCESEKTAVRVVDTKRERLVLALKADGTVAADYSKEEGAE